MKVWILDPTANTPYYDLDLTKALNMVDVEARLMTSRFLYDEQQYSDSKIVDYFFFKPLERWAEGLRRRGRIRRSLRLIIYPFDLYRLWRQFHKTPPDILHVQWMLLPGATAWILRLLSKKTPLVLTVHNPLPRAERFANFTDVRALYDIASHIIVHAEQNRDALLARAAIDPAKVSVVPLGPSLLEQPEVSREESRTKLALPFDAQVVLFFGLIKPYKGLLDLIEAMALLKQKYPKARLLIAGRSEGTVTPYIDRITGLGLETITTAHMEFIPSEDVPVYFAASDVVCFPYRDASQSAALLTAYRFRKSVVVTNVGGLPETVEEGVNGYVVSAQNPPALADALSKFLADPEKCARFGQRSYELSQTHFGWQRAAELTRAIYEKVARDFNA